MRDLVSRNNRYLLAIAGIVATAILLVGLAYGLTESERGDAVGDAQRQVELDSLVSQLAEVEYGQQVALDDYLLTGTPTALTAYRDAVTEEGRLASEIQASATDLPALPLAVSAITRASAAWRDTFAIPTIAAVQANGPVVTDPSLRATFIDPTSVSDAIATLHEQLRQTQAANVQRESAVATSRSIATGVGLGGMLAAAVLALWLIRRYGRVLEVDAARSSVLNRFTEVASFAVDDRDVAAANLEALDLLVHPDVAVTHVLNRSKDRAIPEAHLGAVDLDVLPLHALSRCAGVIRGGLYVTDDAAAPLSVHCPVYPATVGSLACVPLNSGEWVGAVHLYWSRPDALPLELRPSVVRIAEHAALAIGNRRLLAALQGQASTDARTGLANTRSFDEALEEVLAARAPEETVAVLMLDIDHFKDFNDRHGHPAGDDALRAFAEVLRSCMRVGDVAARYGGEEFAVLLPGVDAHAAQAIAERIRTRTETTIIAMGPGVTDRITVSIGIALAPDQGVERVALLRLADEALYRAKASGRNRVDSVGELVSPGAAGPVASSVRRTRGKVPATTAG